MEMDMRENNSASISGKIVSELEFGHEVYGEGFYKFFIEVPRLSDTVDILPITISERLIDRELFTVGSLVDISGQLRSYNNFSENKNRLILTIFTREIKLSDNSMNNPNIIELDGFICKKPVYRTTPFGREITDMLVAVNRSYNKSDYIPCIAWGRNARFAGTLEVGDNIKITGRMQSRNYQKKTETGEITERVAYEVSVSKIIKEDKNDEEDKEL
ncbi:MAG: single-stranded DNA-binding protein [Firmicutes bacterium]|nr:single-stranded DNA-binding protein [Bacillota bacterium]